jgi:uncharacterized protein (DUF697 family)
MAHTEPAASASATSTVTLDAVAAPAGRLAVLTSYAALAAMIPVPFIPDRLISVVRGALVHDIASRHGLSLTSDARTALSVSESELRTRLMRAAETLARQLLRQLRPLGVLSAASRGLEMFALGLLLERYLARVRTARGIRIDQQEARLLRTAIDRTVVRAFSPALRPETTTVHEGVEDLRDELTRWVDTLVLTSAALPGYLERRLEAAFDEVVALTPGLRDGDR